MKVSVRRLKCARGFTLVDVLNATLLIAVITGGTTMLGQRTIARYQLNAAARTFAADVTLAKMRAIQTNAIATLKRESDRDYRAYGLPRQLPGAVRFDVASDDSVAFNGLGASADRTTGRFVLVNQYGDVREIHIYAAGGQEVLRL